MSNILILPDIHGRTFWKEPCLEHCDEFSKIIFLGDYVDPYEYEGITADAALENFKEILDFAKNHSDKVIMLLGNHDLPYINEYFYDNAQGGRFSARNAVKLNKLFAESDAPPFSLAFETEVNGKTFLFSHAPVLKEWYEKHKDIIGESTAENINHLLDNDNGIKALCDISYYRGGYSDCGSVVWADVRECERQGLEGDGNLYYIFGHTQQLSSPIIKEHYACLDCRQAFILNENGEITEL